MKFNSFFLLTLLAIFSSCSNNDDNPNEVPNPIISEKAYAYNGNIQKLIEFDLSNGQELEVSETFQVFDNSFFPKYLPSQNLIIGIDANFNSSSIQYEPRLVKINLENGTVEFVNLMVANNYGEIVVANNKVYAYSGNVDKIVEINIADGSETEISNTFIPFDDYFIPEFNSQTNEIIGRANNYNSTTNQNEPRLIKINVSDGNVSYLELNSNDYSDIVIGNGNTYVLNNILNKMVEINLADGSENEVSNTISVFDGHFVPSYIKSTNEIVGIDDENNKLIKVKLENGEVTYINLSNSNFGEIVIK